MSAPAASAGLQAVARVRAVREQDSLHGLQSALRDADHDRARAEALEERLDRTPAVLDGSVAAFLQLRTTTLALGSAAGDAQQRRATSETVAVAALSHWQHDRTQLDAIELLLERRAEEARAERVRLEAGELDEIAGQLWRRRHVGGAA